MSEEKVTEQRPPETTYTVIILKDGVERYRDTFTGSENAGTDVFWRADARAGSHSFEYWDKQRKEDGEDETQLRDQG